MTMGKQDIIHASYDGQSNLEHIKSPAEIRAMYVKSCAEYQKLMQQRVDPREQRVMLYAEIHVLAWILGKSEQQMQRDISV